MEGIDFPTRRAGSFSLFFHRFRKTLFIAFHAIFLGDFVSEVAWETIGIVEFENLFAREFFLLFDHLFEESFTA